MDNFLTTQADEWLLLLPTAINERTWLERQVVKYLYWVKTPNDGTLSKENLINPLRLYLFNFWIIKMLFRAVFRGLENG